MRRYALYLVLGLSLAPLAHGQERAEAPAAPREATDAEAVDVDALRKEYEGIRERLFTSRARAAVVGDALYSSQLRIHLKHASGRFWAVRRATIRLDGANVYDDTQGAIVGDDAPRFEGFVAPGRHVVTIRIEAVSRDDDRITTTTEDSFTIDVPQKKLVLVRAKAADDGDMGWSWKRKAKGSYALRLDVRVEAREPAGAAAGAARRTAEEPGVAAAR